MNPQELEGVWRLVAFEKHDPSGAVTHPQGKHPVGLLTYLRTGRVTAQLASTDHPYLDGAFLAYFGAYSVDPASHTVTHRIEACVRKDWIGTRQVRTFHRHGNTLVLSTRRAGAELRAIWERHA